MLKGEMTVIYVSRPSEHYPLGYLRTDDQRVPMPRAHREWLVPVVDDGLTDLDTHDELNNLDRDGWMDEDRNKNRLLSAWRRLQMLAPDDPELHRDIVAFVQAADIEEGMTHVVVGIPDHRPDDEFPDACTWCCTNILTKSDTQKRRSASER